MSCVCYIFPWVCLLGDFEFLAESSCSIDSLSPELELLSQEISFKGPQKSDLELRCIFKEQKV